MSTKLSLLLLALGATVLARGAPCDHGHEPGTGAIHSGPITLTETMVRNLDLQLAEVGLRTVEKIFPALGQVEADQARISAVSPRISGRVTRLAVHEGQRVKAGDLLLELESRVVADPPPRIEFNASRDGIVLDLHTVTGEAVAPEAHLLRIADLTEVFAVAQVYEGQLANVKNGQRVRVRPIAFADTSFDGEVTHTAARLDRETGTLRVFVRVANPDGKLLPGMRVQLAFVTAESEMAVVVPRAALLGDGGDLFVFRELADAPRTFERTPVVVGLRDDRFVEIIDGVLPGDRVVVRGNYQLQFVVDPASAGSAHDHHGHSR